MSKPKKNIILILSALALFALALMLTGPGKISAINNGQGTGSTSLDFPSLEADSISTAIIRSEEEPMIWSMLKLIGALVVVVAGIYGFLYLLRKMMGGRLSSNRSNRIIEVLETSYVAQKKSVSLVRFSDRAVLVGVTDNNMTPLAELSSEETAKILQEMQSEKSSAGFKNILSNAKEKYFALSAGKAKTPELAE
jgi:flagellar biosynthetic protein FliO